MTEWGYTLGGKRWGSGVRMWFMAEAKKTGDLAGEDASVRPGFGGLTALVDKVPGRFLKKPDGRPPEGPMTGKNSLSVRGEKRRRRIFSLAEYLL